MFSHMSRRRRLRLRSPFVYALYQANAWTKHYETLCVHLLLPKVVPYRFWMLWNPPLSSHLSAKNEIAHLNVL